MLKDRILQFIEYKGISKNKFYIQTGIANGTLDKKSGLSMESVEKFYSSYKEINPEWILTGKGDMLKKEHNKNQIEEPISKYNKSNLEKLPIEEKLNLIIEQNEKLIQQNRELRQQNEENIKEIVGEPISGKRFSLSDIYGILEDIITAQETHYELYNLNYLREKNKLNKEKSKS